MLRTLLLPNLTFEEEVSGATDFSRSTQRAVDELAPVMGLLHIGSLDRSWTVLVNPNGSPEDVPAVLQSVQFATLRELAESGLQFDEFAPWGWSVSAERIKHKFSPLTHSVTPVVAGLVNSRSFHAPFDDVAPVTAPQACRLFGTLCSTVDELQAALQSFSAAGWSQWLIKADLSHAARNRISGSGPFSAAQQGWLKSRLDHGQKVYAEPLVDVVSECGLQFKVCCDDSGMANCEFLGAVPMLTDGTGKYRGSALQTDNHAAEWETAAIRCREIAMAAAEAGYAGPIGMDSMLFRAPESGELWLRFCHDINARLTMGRIALALRPLLESGESGLWCHVSAEKSEKLFQSLRRKGVRIVVTSAERIGGQPTHLRTFLLISRDKPTLAGIVPEITGQNDRMKFVQ